MNFQSVAKGIKCVSKSLLREKKSEVEELMALSRFYQWFTENIKLRNDNFSLLSSFFYYKEWFKLTRYNFKVKFCI